MRLGILGGGQLARMLTLAAYPLGIRTLCFDPNPDACAGDVTELMVADYNDEKALNQFLSQVDCVTIETENVPLSCVEFILKTRDFYPSVKALEMTQDRFFEKSFLNSLKIPTPAFIIVNSLDELTQAISELGYPAVLKTRRFGYDGKGQYILRSELDILKSWNVLQNESLILEQFISFEREFSLIAVRNKEGKTLSYPLTHNHHVAGVLHSSEAPFNNHLLQREAEQHALKILDALDYIGVLTIEYFYDGTRLIANEIAPRVHNSGHWTIEGAQTSQFENHLRAIFDLPLGSTEVIGNCFMLNCLGKMIPIKACLNIQGIHYHTYGKIPLPGRKIGHITLIDLNLKRYQKNKTLLLEIHA
jgi:5-(carboxyamino)imidazole ribonucleotide synthase